MAIPAFIAANPGLSLSAVSLLSKLGSGLLGRNDAKDAMTKAEEENRQIMARANLRQSFGGNPSVNLVQPKLDPGLGTTLLSKLGDAAGLASTAYGLYDANKLRNLQMQNVQGQIDARDLTTQTGIEAADRARLLQQGAGQYAQDVAGQVRKVQQGPSLGSKMPSFGGPSISSPPLGPTAQQGYFDAAGAAADRFRTIRGDEADIAKTLAEIGKLENPSTIGSGGGRGGTGSPIPVGGLDYKRIESERKIGTPMMVSAAANGTPWEKVLTNSVIMQFDPNTIPSLQALYENEQGAILAKQNAGLANFLYKDLKGKFTADPFIKKSGDLKFGMGLLAKGYNQQNGAGDLMMINAMVRLSDPGVSVRPMEAEQMAQVGGELSRLGLITSGEKWLDGDKFMPHVREKLLKAGTELYGGSAEVINESLLREAAAATIPVLNLTGKQDINQVPALGSFLDTYRLPPLSIYGIKSGVGSVRRSQQRGRLPNRSAEFGGSK